MSRTKRKYKGIEYPDSSRKRRKDKKFFGFTSGQHSRGIVDISIENGKVIYTKSDRTPIKGEDFVKYGWPLELRNKNEIVKYEKDQRNIS